MAIIEWIRFFAVVAFLVMGIPLGLGFAWWGLWWQTG